MPSARTKHLSTSSRQWRGHRLGARLLVACFLCAAAATTVTSKSAAQTQDHSHVAEFGVGVASVTRIATSDRSINPSGIAYKAAIGESVYARIPLLRWLRWSMYYIRSSHQLEIPQGAIDVPAARIQQANVFSFSLGTRIEPTLHIGDRLILWVSAGAAWGRMTTPRFVVDAPTRSYSIDERAGVFLEIPFGFGVSYEVFKPWVSVSFETTISWLTGQNGTLFDPIQVTDSNGQLGHSPGMPTLTTSTSQMLGVSVLF